MTAIVNHTIQQDGATLFQPITALLLDDSAFDRKRIHRMAKDLNLPMHLDDAETIAAFEQQLNTKTYDMIFIDHHLPEGDGFDALKLIKACDTNNKAATIMVSGANDLDIAVSAMRSGCNDYLSKEGLNPESLQLAIFGALQASSLAQGDTSDSELNAVASDIIARISDTCLGDIRPLVLRVLRNTRNARRAMSKTDSKVAPHLASVEATCMSLCTFLEDISIIKQTHPPNAAGLQPSSKLPTPE